MRAMISGVQEENGSGQKGLFESLGRIQSESRVKGMQYSYYYYT